MLRIDPLTEHGVFDTEFFGSNEYTAICPFVSGGAVGSLSAPPKTGSFYIKCWNDIGQPTYSYSTSLVVFGS